MPRRTRTEWAVAVLVAMALFVPWQLSRERYPDCRRADSARVVLPLPICCSALRDV